MRRFPRFPESFVGAGLVPAREGVRRRSRAGTSPAPTFLLLLLFALPAWSAVEVRAALEPETIGIDQTATFTIEVRGDGFSSLGFRHDFEMDNLETLGGASRYEDMTFSNGRLSRTLRYSWQVRPLGLGKARVRAIVVRVDDREVRLPAAEIKVQQEPVGDPQRRLSRGQDEEEDPFQRFFGRMPNPWRREPQQPEVFLKAEVQPARPVVGQQVLYTIYLYTREDIAAISPSGIPTFRGFWVRDIPLPQQLPTEMMDIDGRRYGRVPLLKKALFPLRPGPYRLEPATIDVTVQRYERFFFGPPVARPEPVQLQTAAQTVNVQPLPPAPPGFGGAVGQLAVSAQLEPKEIKLGEAATLTVRLSGVGNLQGIQEPRVQPPPGLDVRLGQQEGKDELNGSAVRGTRVWRYAVIPERAGRFTLDTPKVPYFDPAEGRYEVAAAPDLALAVAAPPTVAKPASLEPAPPKTAGLPGRRWSPVLPWLVALPWGLVLVAALVRQRSARQGEGLGEEGRRLEEEIRLAAAEERPRQMAMRIEEAWRDFFLHRWGVPRETPPSRWRELLAGREVEDGALDELGLLIEDLQYLRFAPQLSTTDALRADALARCRRLLRSLS